MWLRYDNQKTGEEVMINLATASKFYLDGKKCILIKGKDVLNHKDQESEEFIDILEFETNENAVFIFGEIVNSICAGVLVFDAILSCNESGLIEIEQAPSRFYLGVSSIPESSDQQPNK